MIIYRLTCIPTGKIYIGITKWSAERRFAGHWYQSRSAAAASGRPLLHAIQKYGREAWTVETLACALTFDDACVLEKAFIAEHNATNRMRGYNVTAGGDGAPGRKQSPEEIEKRAAKMRGRTHTVEAKSAMSRASKGKPKSPQHVARIVAARTGCHKTAEQIERSAVFHRGRKRSDTTKKKLSDLRAEWWRRQKLGEVLRAQDIKINWARDAEICAAHFELRSYKRAGARFGITGSGACFAVKRVCARVAESMEAAQSRLHISRIYAPLHPSWIEFALPTVPPKEPPA